MKGRSIAATAVALSVILSSCCTTRWSEEEKDGYNVISQRKGATLGYSPESGVKIIVSEGYAFKDLNRNGVLDGYEDWRLSMRERAEDLASRLSIDEIAGLMLYSEHQAVPADSVGYWSSTYNGMSLVESGLPHSAVSDRQKKFLAEDNVRAILQARAESPRIAAEWNNNLQAFCEGLGHGIPVNISSDPRHETEARAEFNSGSGGKISYWPCQLGLAATFDPEVVKEFGRIGAVEYRAMGIATALSPQADLGTEPRWFRFYGTFGENPDMVSDMVRAYVDGFQTSGKEKAIDGSWGYESVNCMTKHWPGGGSGESGRDAHYCFGKYSVYPGNGFDEQIKPFSDGAFCLEDGTETTSAIMPYYTISYGIDPDGNNVGNSYSRYMIQDLLRDGYGYDGVICTDWAVTHDYHKVEESNGKCWGHETETEAERHFAVLLAGVDQFGGNNDKGPVLEAYEMWVEHFGKESARRRFEKSAERLLMNMFRTGLFDNPYVDPDVAERLVGCPEFMEAGYKAQLKSIVMLKNRGAVIPQSGRKKVWFPQVHKMPSQGFFGGFGGEERWEYPIDTALVGKYYDMAETPEEADFAFVFINEPQGGHGYDVCDRNAGGNGYVPISLQYEDYVAEYARDVSIAGGDPLEPSANRSYKGKMVRTANKPDLELVRDTRLRIGDKPLIVAVPVLRPFVPAEIEPYADGLVLAINVQHQAVLDIISGAFEPQGLLPMQLPASMKTVEEQSEDKPYDMECHVDSEGHTYDFAYGMNWKGVIDDERVRKYRPCAPVAPYAVYTDGLISDIEAEGWLETFLQRQRDGMTGHPESMSYPYDSNLWNGEIVRNTESYGSDWWRYEQTAYYTDGLARLAYLLKDEELMRKAEEGIEYTLSHSDERGRLAHSTFRFASMWPMAVFWRAVKAYYDVHGNTGIPNLLERHYMSFSMDELQQWRNIMSIEGMLWTYGLTGRKELLERSETAWNSGKFGDLTPEACRADSIPFMHGVTFCEELKLPVLLYMYTGKYEYLDAALNAYDVMARDNMLPDGVNASAEALVGNGNIINSHETCDIADLTWTMGYFLEATGDPVWADRIERAVFNAGTGCVTKDFKSLQYFSSVNQFRVTGDSNHNGFFYGSTWMAYRPTHQTECCAGNVHRIMPNYVSRMWMKGRENELVAAMYGPSEILFVTDEGKIVRVKEKTDYPFDGKITFEFDTEECVLMNFTYRIPCWTEDARVYLNGKRLSDDMAEPGRYHTLNMQVRDGDEVEILLPMKPVLETVGAGSRRYDAAVKDYVRGTGIIEPTSVNAAAALPSGKPSTSDNDGGIQGAYVRRGPLLYSFAIPYVRTEDVAVYENMNGKVPGDTSFKCWSFEPDGAWNYALDLSRSFSMNEHIERRIDGYPFESGASSVTIEIPVRRIRWELVDGRFTPPLPVAGEVTPLDDETVMLPLIPYGCTELRLTVFPLIGQ